MGSKRKVEEISKNEKMEAKAKAKVEKAVVVAVPPENVHKKSRNNHCSAQVVKKARSSSSSGSSSDSDDMKQIVMAAPAKKNEATPATHTPVPAASHDADAELKIFVREVPWKVTEEDVRDYFKSCGTITTCELPLQPDGRSSGTAHVTFSNRKTLTNALKLNGSTWPGTKK